MEDSVWKEIIEGDLSQIDEMLTTLGAEVRKMEGPTARLWLAPIKAMLFEATLEALEHRTERIAEGERLLGGISEGGAP
jgi:hypothetical protein